LGEGAAADGHETWKYYGLDHAKLAKWITGEFSARVSSQRWRIDIFPWRTLLGGVIDELGKQVLKGVSRSFYLTLRLLPGPMRGAASLGYLLARTSDTLADSAVLPVEDRQRCLDQFRRCVSGEADFQPWPDAILNAVTDVRERRLLECSESLLRWLRRLPAGEAGLVREVLAIIISGQTLDLERFANATGESPVALQDDGALEDYAWRVAGCVGAFWTKLGFLTLGDEFSNSPEAELVGQGVAYGKALQLVNILRDVAADLAVGRCYLPVADPGDSSQLLACHARWLARAEQWLGDGEKYAATLRRRRLRAATVLPALLARKTLKPLHGATWADLQRRNKIPRSAVYRSVVEAFLKPPGGIG
jgi:farnesyl-diphosphate farnesyltransferase